MEGNDESLQMIEDINDEDSDDFEELSDEDEDQLDDAIDSIKESTEMVNQAYEATNEVSRVARLESAVTRLDEAHSALRNADSRTLQRIADDLEDRAGLLEDQIDVIYGRSVTGDLNKEQTREDNGRFGPSTSPKEPSGRGDGSFNRDDAEVLGNKSEIEDLRDSVDDLQNELLDAGDTDGAEACDEASVALINAKDNLNSAVQAKDGGQHTRAVQESIKDLERARNALEDVEHSDADDFQDGIAETIDGLESYVASVYNRPGKSASIALQLSETTDKAEKSEVMDDKTEKKELKPAKGESKLDFMKRCKEAGMKRAEARGMYDKYMAADAEDGRMA
jgi:predicted metal-dependent hydrolase